MLYFRLMVLYYSATLHFKCNGFIIVSIISQHRQYRRNASIEFPLPIKRFFLRESRPFLHETITLYDSYSRCQVRKQRIFQKKSLLIEAKKRRAGDWRNCKTPLPQLSPDIEHKNPYVTTVLKKSPCSADKGGKRDLASFAGACRLFLAILEA